MKIMPSLTRAAAAGIFPALVAVFVLAPAASVRAQTPSSSVAVAPGILSREQAAAILPTTVFFRGQVAPIQSRNSAGFRLAEGKLVLAALVDTSGYSTAIQQTYQAYLLSEVNLTIAGQTLSPGAYGFGFVAGGSMVVMDLGGNEVLRVPTMRDEALPRPTPLQVVAASAPGQFRLYLGRSFVTLARASR